MKMIPKIFVLGLIGIVSSSSFAQKQLTEKDVTELRDKAYARQKSLAYRMIRVTETFEDKNKTANHRIERTEIFLPPNSIHTILQDESERGVVRTETISIDGRKYTKEGDGEWILEPFQSDSRGNRIYGRWGDPEPKPEIETTVTGSILFITSTQI